MVNAVGLQGPGVAAWLADDLPALVATGARVVASIWGRTVDDYAEAALLLADAPGRGGGRRGQPVVPQPRGQGHVRPVGRRHPRRRRRRVGVPAGRAGPSSPRRWPTSPQIAAAAADGGAEAVTLVNTLPAMVIDVDAPPAGAGRPHRRAVGRRHPPRRRAGRARRARRACRRCRSWASAASPTPSTAVELLLAGASAVQVGTATFADRRAVARRARRPGSGGARRHGVARVSELVGGAHGSP